MDASDPAAGGTIDFYWSHSESATAATGNTGKTSGADGAYTGYDTLTLAESLVHLQFIGTLTCGVNNDVDGVQFGAVGYFMPRARYGSLVVVNNLSVALHSDAVEMGVRFIPIFDDIQAAA